MKSTEKRSARRAARNADPVLESLRLIRSRTTLRPSIAVVLGSGLGDFAEGLTQAVSIPTTEIPHYPHSTVVGHRGQLVFGRLGRIPLLAFQGRVHYYETGTLETVLYPIRVAHALGIRTLLVTNAAGGIRKTFRPGDLMLIEDQINLTFEQPLAGTRTARLSAPCYDLSLRDAIREAARSARIPIRRGVYLGLKGPSYETAAEIRMARALGADAVGMSTVNEVSLAAALGMRIAGFSCITNMATGILDEKLSHSEVTDVANMVKTRFTRLLSLSVEAAHRR
jgi:purine-nucleoside phosphorylase